MNISYAQYENDLITSVLTTQDTVKRSTVIDKLSVDMFASVMSKAAWRAITELSHEGELVDGQGVSSRMGGGECFTWLVEIMSSSPAKPSNIIGYAKRVRQAFYLRDARKRAVESIKIIDGLSDITQVDTIASSIEYIFDGLVLETNDKKPQLFKDVARDYVNKLNDKANGKEDKHIVLTNIPDLDKNTGGFNKTDLVVIGGLSGSGKTEFSVKIMRGMVSDNSGALIFSLEMSNHQVVERAISGEAQLPVSNLRNPKMLEYGDGWNKLSYGLGQLVDKDIYMTDQTGLTVNSIIATAKRHKNDHPNLNLIIVDHVGLMELDKSASRHDLQVGEISKKLKQLAKDIEVPVVLLTQLTGKQIMHRPVNEREPRATDIKDSSRIEEDSDLILLCHRQWTHDESAPNIAEIIFAKARHAIKGTKVYFRFIDGHFIDTAQDMASNEMEHHYNKQKTVSYKKSDALK